ncbi:rCG52485, partial [Rattus norvegicus]
MTLERSIQTQIFSDYIFIV